MQAAVDQLFADVAQLAAPGSSFLFDFLHEDALTGVTQPVGYANTAQVGVLVTVQPYSARTRQSLSCSHDPSAEGCGV